MASVVAARATDLDGVAAKARLVLTRFEDPEVWRYINGVEADKVRVAPSALQDVIALVGDQVLQ